MSLGSRAGTRRRLVRPEQRRSSRRPTLNEAEERDLIAALRAGDPRALAVVHAHLGDTMSTLAASLMRNRTEAEDVVEEALVRAYRGGPAFRGERGVRTWVLRIVANLCRDRLRRRRFDGGTFDEETSRARVALASDPVSGWDAALDHARLAESVRGALRTLSVELREAVVLRHQVGMSHEEMVEVLGIPLGTVKSRIARGLAALRLQLGDWNS